MSTNAWEGLCVTQRVKGLLSCQREPFGGLRQVSVNACVCVCMHAVYVYGTHKCLHMCE